MTAQSTSTTSDQGATQPLNRRQALSGGVLIAATATTPTNIVASGGQTDWKGSLMHDVARYVDFGIKRSGGAGDNGVGAWLEDELRANSFTCSRHEVIVPWFEPDQASLFVGDTALPVLPVGIPVQTPAAGITGTLHIVDAQAGLACLSPGSLNDGIAVATLPYARWSSALTKPVTQLVSACRDAGARAVLLVTTGPSGKAVMLNAKGDGPMFDLPVATIAPDDAATLAAKCKGAGRLVLHGRAGTRKAFNLIGRVGPADAPAIVVSTPRSGWFACGAERGPGIALWLHLARRLASEGRLNATFLCTSGHEYENMGMERIIETAMPPASKTKLWLHLGAGFAAVDWHELGGKLIPLTSVDAQRFLSASPHLVDTCRSLFANQPGLDRPYMTTQLLAGELKIIASKGYPEIVGLFGAHRLHHVGSDNADCVCPPALNAVAASVDALFARIS